MIWDSGYWCKRGILETGNLALQQMCFPGGERTHYCIHIAHNQEGDSTAPLSSVYCSEDSQQTKPSALAELAAAKHKSSESVGRRNLGVCEDRHPIDTLPFRREAVRTQACFFQRASSFEVGCGSLEKSRGAGSASWASDRPGWRDNDTLDNKHGQPRILEQK